MPSLTLGEARHQMSAIRRNFDTEVASIRNNSGLNAAGRRQAIAKTLIAQREKVRTLRSNFEVYNEGTRAEMSAKLFGIPKGADPSTVLIHRDAADRAAQLDKIDDATATLKRALEHGDTVLARAVAAHAHGKRWDQVVTAYAEQTGHAGDLETLNDIPSGGLSKLAVNTLFLVRTPQEVQSVRGDCPDGELERIAAGEA
jgi:hypothetical protein